MAEETAEKLPNEDDVFEYLDELRESGVTNMFGAGPFISRAFGDIDARQARKYLSKWMSTYETRHPQS